MASSSLTRNIQSFKQSLPHYLSKTDAHVFHLNRLLSQTSTLDTTLLALTYTLHLLHSQLSRLTARRLPIPPSKSPPPNPSSTPLPSEKSTSQILSTLIPPHSRLLHLTTFTAALAALLDDIRLFLRLWGLASIYAWGVRTWKQPPKDTILKAVAWAQVGVNTAYQVLENGAYLAEKGVLVGWERGKVEKWWLWSSRFWAAHVVLDLGRLMRVRMMRQRSELEQRKSAGGEGVGSGEKEEKMVREVGEREGRQWWRELVVNLAYAPMTVHWSLPGGLLSEAQVGGLGVLVGVIGLGEAWRGCA